MTIRTFNNRANIILEIARRPPDASQPRNFVFGKNEPLNPEEKCPRRRIAVSQIA